MPMPRQKREEPFTRRNITFPDELHDELMALLPYGGARDFSSILELAGRRLVAQVKGERKRK